MVHNEYIDRKIKIKIKIKKGEGADKDRYNQCNPFDLSKLAECENDCERDRKRKTSE